MNSSTTTESVVEMDVAAVVFIGAAAGLCSLLTVFGNFFVILAFITNRTLRNFSNYLILNLAISDLIIGLFSMNIFVVYNVSGSWTMGKAMCNAWLTVDYVVSNTSVMNLLVICIDRYLAITSPVKYRRICTPNMAALVMCLTWTISFILWAPAILIWDVISPGSDPVSQGKCSIPFMASSAAVTLITALGAFYLPAAAMIALYWRVIVKIEKQTSSVSAMISRATTAISARYTSPWVSTKTKVLAEDGERNGDEEKDNNSNEQKAKNDDENAAEVGFVEKTVSEKPDANSVAHLLRKASKRYKGSLSAQRDTSLDKSSTAHLLKKEDTKSSSGPELSVTPHSFTRSEEDSFQPQEKPPEESARPTASAKRLATHTKLKKNSSSLSLIHRHNESRLHREKRATTLLKSILICFISLWLPYNVIVVASGICGDDCISGFMWTLSYWLCYLNSTANPFCYGYCNENFQRTFKALITIKWWTPAGRRQMRCQVKGGNPVRAV